MSRNRPYTYDQCMDIISALNVGADDYAIPVRPNTFAQRDGNTFAVILYGTKIATLYADGSVRVNRRGNLTVTTRNRLDDVLIPLGWQVRIRGGEWRLTTVLAPYKSMEFIDDMILTRVIDGKDQA